MTPDLAVQLHPASHLSISAGVTSLFVRRYLDGRRAIAPRRFPAPNRRANRTRHQHSSADTIEQRLRDRRPLPPLPRVP